MLREPITFTPDHMRPWGINVEVANPTEFGKFAVVDIQPHFEEQHHAVLVIDEDGDPLTGIRVMFGFPGGGGRNYGRGQGRNYWVGGPAVLNGNAPRTLVGVARHTTAKGGEDIWVDHIEPNGELQMSSDIVKNCKSIDASPSHNLHTGVFIVFQRHRVGVVPKTTRWNTIETRLMALEEAIGISGA